MDKRLVKCPGCGEMFDRNAEKFVHHKNRYYHTSCFEKTIGEQEDIKRLNDYINKELNQGRGITIRVKKQIENLVGNNYTYSGILKTLIYFYEIKKNPKDKAHGGIGIVPYQYKEAYDYFYKLHCGEAAVPVEEYEYGVYGIYIDGSLGYVGKTVRPFEERWDEHKRCAFNPTKEDSKLGQQNYLYKAIREAKEIEFKKLFTYSSIEDSTFIDDKSLQMIEMTTITLLKPIYNYEGVKVPYRFS